MKFNCGPSAYERAVASMAARYDPSSYRCVICGQFITMKDFVDGKAGRVKSKIDKAEHSACRKALESAR